MSLGGEGIPHKIFTVKNADEANGKTARLQYLYCSRTHNDTCGLEKGQSEYKNTISDTAYLFSKSINCGLSMSRHLDRDDRGINLNQDC